MLAFRARLYEMVRGRGGHVDERLTLGDRVACPCASSRARRGRVDYRGSSWTARNIGDAAIEAGREAEIVAIDRLTSTVRRAP